MLKKQREEYISTIKKAGEVEQLTAQHLPFHIFYNQIQLLQIFIVNQFSAVFHHLQDVLLHGV